MSFSDIHNFFDDVEVDQEWISLGRTITEADIINFAGVSGDYNPIHIDHEFAKTTPFRKPIAHGVLVWSISSGLSVYAPPMRTLAFLRVENWEFKRAVFVGDTIRVNTKILEIDERSRGRRAEITWHRQIINQDEQVVQGGITVTLVEGRANLQRSKAKARAKLDAAQIEASVGEGNNGPPVAGA
ncbi:MAG: MaoC/PaaZ C-terminal domain-containing protein [Gemmataceae bacterium]